MLEAGMSLIAVNLPSLWLFFTSLLPEKVVRSIRSVIALASLSSQRSNGLDRSSATIRNGPATRLGRRPESSSSMYSGHPYTPSDFSVSHYHQQLSGHPEDRNLEEFAMHDTDGKWRESEKAPVSRG